MTQPLFFKVINKANPNIVSFVNAAHVIRINIEATTGESGTLHLIDGSTVELDAIAADKIMTLMAKAEYDQDKELS